MRGDGNPKPIGSNGCLACTWMPVRFSTPRQPQSRTLLTHSGENRDTPSDLLHTPGKALQVRGDTSTERVSWLRGPVDVVGAGPHETCHLPPLGISLLAVMGPAVLRFPGRKRAFFAGRPDAVQIRLVTMDEEKLAVSGGLGLAVPKTHGYAAAWSCSLKTSGVWSMRSRISAWIKRP